MNENEVPTIFVIFGATGDLAHRKLFPALLELFEKKLLPSKFHIVAFARRPFTDETFRAEIVPSLEKAKDKEILEAFLKHITFSQGLFDDARSYETLAKKLQKIDEEAFKVCSNKLFYLAVPPNFYESIATKLKSSGLTIPCGGDLGWTRVLIEKPFGSDIPTAKNLDRLLGSLFKEEQIFRIDHYLAKEALQNILAFRFGNSPYESSWNNTYIDKITLSLLEKNGIGDRGTFYDQIGALRDVGQNHMMVMLSIIAMDKPSVFTYSEIQKKRAKVLEKLLPIGLPDLKKIKKGQYEDYRSEKNVRPDSTTETFFKIEAYLNNPKFKDVPFILESGKGMFEDKVEICVYFKKGLQESVKEPLPDKLTFKIQPKEEIVAEFNGEKKHFEMRAEGKKYQVSLDAYERVLYDCVRGDQTLFTSTEEVEASWKFIDSVIEAWKDIPLKIYKRGSNSIEL